MGNQIPLGYSNHHSDSPNSHKLDHKLGYVPSDKCTFTMQCNSQEDGTVKTGAKVVQEFKTIVLSFFGGSTMEVLKNIGVPEYLKS